MPSSARPPAPATSSSSSDPSVLDPDQSYAYFMNEAVPAYVEVELGILEPHVLRKYRSIPIAAVQRQYLSSHVAQVHIFRQRIPIANINFAAYP